MRLFHKILLNLCVIISFFVIFYALHEETDPLHVTKLKGGHINATFKLHRVLHNAQNTSPTLNINNVNENVLNISYESGAVYNVWCIFTKVKSNLQFKTKFKVFVQSLLQFSSVPLTLNILSDEFSWNIAKDIIEKSRGITSLDIKTQYFNVTKITEDISDIIQSMQPYFSSQPGAYYGDALFLVSIGLHRVITSQQRVVLIDIDTKLQTDIKLLFDEFSNFSNETLFAFSPEQCPVYRHVLNTYRSKNRQTKFGDPLSKNGNPGVNSGVGLFDWSRMRESTLYNKAITPSEVKRVVDKYYFRGHLGDQDFYTILSEEYKNMVYFLDCSWNRQLCQWWNHHGYKDVFELFFYCPTKVKIYHGNCNTKIPN